MYSNCHEHHTQNVHYSTLLETRFSCIFVQFQYITSILSAIKVAKLLPMIKFAKLLINLEFFVRFFVNNGTVRKLYCQSVMYPHLLFNLQRAALYDLQQLIVIVCIEFSLCCSKSMASWHLILSGFGKRNKISTLPSAFGQGYLLERHQR